MRVIFVGLVTFAVTTSCGGVGSARAEDGIVIQSMWVEGVIPKADDPLFDPNPYRKDRVPYANITGQLGGGEFCVVVTKDNARGVVYMNFGGDEALKERAKQLAGRRVIVECKGEYQLHTMKVNVRQRQVWAEQEQVFATQTLTVTRIEPAE